MLSCLRSCPLYSAQFYLSEWSASWAEQCEEAATQNASLLQLSVDSIENGRFMQHVTAFKQPVDSRKKGTAPASWWEQNDEAYYKRAVAFLPSVVLFPRPLFLLQGLLTHHSPI